MSTFNSPSLLDLQEQLCYVECGHCTTILLVSVPCSSLSMVVTVKCGHCTGLLSVNMTKANFLSASFHSFINPSLNHLDHQVAAKNVQNPMAKTSPSDDEYEDSIHLNHVVNKPPEKRQRAPSAYNNFIKEEIKRLKAKYPNISHKEAFSAAAKNWSQFPPIQSKRDIGCDDQRKRLRFSDAEGVSLHNLN